jgi:hypothetical protein
MPPKVKSWREAGDTPYRKKHREEAKASPLHIKRRNQEGSCAARCQRPDSLGRHRPEGELSDVVLPQTTQGQIA